MDQMIDSTTDTLSSSFRSFRESSLPIRATNGQPYPETATEPDKESERETQPPPPRAGRRSICPPTSTGSAAEVAALPASVTPEKLGQYLQNVPAKHRNLMGRALLGKSRSPREGIKAKCLECSNFVREEAAACSVWRCPLWRSNPFRVAGR
jgi:hypothetical protein